MKITIEQAREIYESYGLDLTDKELIISLDQCNEQDGISGRSAEQWAHFFASQEAYEQGANDAEMKEFHANAYGE